MEKDTGNLNGRYHGRLNVDEYLTPILNGRIIEQFNPDKGYINWGPYELSDNFEEGHPGYFQKWKHLFLYESYSYMMNSRWSKFSGSDAALAS